MISEDEEITAVVVPPARVSVSLSATTPTAAVSSPFLETGVFGAAQPGVVVTIPAAPIVALGEPAAESVLAEPSSLTVVVAAQGPKGNDGAAIGLVYVQAQPATVWTIAHFLGRHPYGVTVVDTAGDHIITEAVDLDSNTTQLTFGSPTSGTAYLT